jgi:hypothetical protein
VLNSERLLPGHVDCYVGRKPCGCLVAWVYDDPMYTEDVSQSVADLFRRGYSVERANTNEVRHRLGKCKCESSDAQGDL